MGGQIGSGEALHADAGSGQQVGTPPVHRCGAATTQAQPGRHPGQARARIRQQGEQLFQGSDRLFPRTHRGRDRAHIEAEPGVGQGRPGRQQQVAAGGVESDDLRQHQPHTGPAAQTAQADAGLPGGHQAGHHGGQQPRIEQGRTTAHQGDRPWGTATAAAPPEGDQRRVRMAGAGEDKTGRTMPVAGGLRSLTDRCPPMDQQPEAV
jgi:hypothetical protein